MVAWAALVVGMEHVVDTVLVGDILFLLAVRYLEPWVDSNLELLEVHGFVTLQLRELKKEKEENRSVSWNSNV